MSNRAAGDTPGPAPLTWGAVVPAKSLRTAKSRLAELGDVVRRDLVVAFLHDTVSALMTARSVSPVVVVTDDDTLAAVAHSMGAEPIPDAQADLNASLLLGAAQVLRRSPAAGVLAGCADLPALTGGDLDDWLSVQGETPSAFVADVAGTGTTILRAIERRDFTPAFGSRSRVTHARLGARDLSDVAAPGMRHDVDTPADLHAITTRWVGERTRWVLSKHHL